MGKKTAWSLVRITAVLLLAVFALSFTGCANKGIEGTWVLVEEYQADGKKISSKELEELGVSETYEIENGQVKYTVSMKEVKKPISIKMELEDLGGNRYNFNISKGKVTFATAEVKGNTMTYYVGEGDGRMKMVFKRK